MHEAAIIAETLSLLSATQPSRSDRSNHLTDHNENNAVAQGAGGHAMHDKPQPGEPVGQLDDNDDMMTESDSSDTDSVAKSTESDSETEGDEEDVESDLPIDDPDPTQLSQLIVIEPVDHEVRMSRENPNAGIPAFRRSYSRIFQRASAGAGAGINQNHSYSRRESAGFSQISAAKPAHSRPLKRG
ncbi:hypothetical protein RhiJN_24905 [Ceratobasidium sp. AG-Ba]|nr:hypothetical protein RhiJN_24905 [Ceratobasidium sp. AG-Ba]